MVSTAALSACAAENRLVSEQAEKFICPPCGCSVDHVEFDDPGPCSDCGMPLAPKHEEELGFQPTKLAARAGSYEMPGGVGHENHRIRIHYYKPDGFTLGSKVLLIIPGAGRDSADYRNAWLATAREKNILIAALGYAEKDYDFAAYHMGGLVKNIEFGNAESETNTQDARVIRLRDEDLSFEINTDSSRWLFSDLDRFFWHLVSVTNSAQLGYDAFGHSAGGQILHRLTLAQRNSHAKRIVAANSGFYTLPELDTPLPTGLGGLDTTTDTLKKAFARDLTVLLGEADNSDTAGGTMLHTPIVDQQGLGRLARGCNFYNVGKEQAQSLGVPFNWKLKVVPKVDHDFEIMSRAAANLLYP